LSYYSALTIILVAFIVPFGLSQIVSTRIVVEARRRYHEIGIAVFLQLGVVFAVLLAFVFNNVWEQFNEASNAVDQECVDLQSAADRAAYLPENWAINMRQALATYMRSEIDDEWPAMARREVSPATTVAFTSLFAAAAEIPPSDPLVSSTRESMLRIIRDIRVQRQLRLFQLKTNVPIFLWGLLATFSVVLTVFVMLSGVGHNLVQSTLVGIFAALLMAILVTIHLLDYPFEGSVSISPEAVISALDHIDDIPIVYTHERHQ
jgi:hypothetical protein